MISQLHLFEESERRYSIDTSSLVELSVRNPISNYQNLWNSISTFINQRRVFATIEVKNEIRNLVSSTRVDDELLNWCNEHPRLFIRNNQDILTAVKDIIIEFPSFVNFQSHRNHADPYIIACALINGLIVITEEKNKPNRIDIPSVCDALEVPCISVWQFLNDEGIRPDL